MNINDVKIEFNIPPTIAEMASDIFDMQSKLEDFYWQIEGRPSRILSINNRQHQKIIKDILWRITEELGEALEADLVDHTTHYQEELADALHFITALFVDLGFKDLYIDSWTSSDGHWGYDDCRMDLFMSLGLLGNTLKMKPWKQTDILTDEIEFKTKLKFIVMRFVRALRQSRISDKEMFVLYMKKAQVNLFRITSKY